jgi:membrane associated rhomboid family serine protease
MSNYSNYYSRKNILKNPLPYTFFNATYGLIFVNIVVFIFTILPATALFVNKYLALIPQYVFQDGYIWQVLTYMFVHAYNNYTHILFNMLVLFMFGPPVERRIGSWEFLLFYLVTGTLSGIVMLFLGTPVVGASAALFAVMLAFATFFPDTTILLFFFIPLRAPIAVLVVAVLAVVFQFTGTMSGVAHLGHLAGLAFGYFYLWLRLDTNPIRVFWHNYR